MLFVCLGNRVLLCSDLVSIYCALIRWCLNTLHLYGLHSPSISTIMIESVQRKTLRIILLAVEYNSALYQSGLKTLNVRCKEICTNFTSYVRGNGLEPIRSLLPATVNHPHGYRLRSGSTSQSRPCANTNRRTNFMHSRYA